MGYIVGRDALDIARMTGLQLHRTPARRGATPDTSVTVAEHLIANERHVKEEDFFFDTDDWSPEDTYNVVESLIGLYKATLDGCVARKLHYPAV